MPTGEEILFDPCKVRFDLTLPEAFRLTQVKSLDDFLRLKQMLPEIRGSSYFFINRLDGGARLMVTIIIAEGGEVTASFALNHDALGIGLHELTDAAPGTGENIGNYPLPPEVERKVRCAMTKADRLFIKLE
jgi:hypothetical protein